jgi:hypothetical protein
MTSRRKAYPSETMPEEDPGLAVPRTTSTPPRSQPATNRSPCGQPVGQGPSLAEQGNLNVATRVQALDIEDWPEGWLSTIGCAPRNCRRRCMPMNSGTQPATCCESWLDPGATPDEQTGQKPSKPSPISTRGGPRPRNPFAAAGATTTALSDMLIGTDHRAQICLIGRRRSVLKVRQARSAPAGIA